MENKNKHHTLDKIKLKKCEINVKVIDKQTNANKIENTVCIDHVNGNLDTTGSMMKEIYLKPNSHKLQTAKSNKNHPKIRIHKKLSYKHSDAIQQLSSSSDSEDEVGKFLEQKKQNLLLRPIPNDIIPVITQINLNDRDDDTNIDAGINEAIKKEPRDITLITRQNRTILPRSRDDFLDGTAPPNIDSHKDYFFTATDQERTNNFSILCCCPKISEVSKFIEKSCKLVANCFGSYFNKNSRGSYLPVDREEVVEMANSEKL